MIHWSGTLQIGTYFGTCRFLGLVCTLSHSANNWASALVAVLIIKKIQISEMQDSELSFYLNDRKRERARQRQRDRQREIKRERERVKWDLHRSYRQVEECDSMAIHQLWHLTFLLTQPFFTALHPNLSNLIKNLTVSNNKISWSAIAKKISCLWDMYHDSCADYCNTNSNK